MEQLQLAVRRYISGAIKLEELERALIDCVWDRPVGDDSRMRDLAAQIEIRICEFADGLYTEPDLKLELIECTFPMAPKVFIEPRSGGVAMQLRKSSHAQSRVIGHRVAFETVKAERTGSSNRPEAKSVAFG